MSQEPERREYLFESGELRERRVLARWMPHFGSAVLQNLGLTGLWWCGLCLPRAEVFGPAAGQGDVDIVAGPLAFSLTNDEIHVRIAEEAAKHPDSHPSRWESFAMLRASEEGLVRWPPESRRVIACEVKASWFDRDAPDPARAWKASHRGETKRVVGQLRSLLRPGVSRIGFVHVGVTRPQGGQDGLNPWLAGGDEAATALTSFPLVFPPELIPGCGYYQVLLRAIEGATEEWRGAGGFPQVVYAAEDQPTGEQVGPVDLLENLGRCARPRTPGTFVLSCSECRTWWTTPVMSGAACLKCGAAWEDGRTTQP